MFNIFGSLVAFAEGEAAQTSGQTPFLASGAGSILMIVLMIVVFYFLLIRPQKKKDKEKKEMLASVGVGDTIATIGGIIGKVVKVREEDITVVTGKLGSNSEQSTLKLKKWSIGEVIKKNEKAKLDEPVIEDDSADADDSADTKSEE